MAVESPLIHDGSSCVAAADYSSGAAQYCAVSLTAARTVTLTGAGAQSYGILQNKPALGQAADVGILGVSKGQAGAAFSAGVPLMSNASGQLIAWTSSNFVVGQSIDAATAEYQLVSVALVPSYYK
jgi:hypothetical protein